MLGERWGAVAGILAVVFTILPASVPHETLSDDASPDEIRTFFAEHFALQEAQALSHSLGALFFLVFAVALYFRGERAEGVTSPAAVMMLLSAAGITTVTIVAMGIVAVAIAYPEVGDPALAGALYSFGWVIRLAGAGYFAVAFLMSVGLAGPERLGLPKWTTMAAFGVSLLQVAFMVLGPFLGGSNFINVRFGAFILLFVWLLAASVTLLARPASGADGMPGATPGPP